MSIRVDLAERRKNKINWNLVKLIIGILMILSGVVLGVYVALWICFIGGIVQLIEAVKIAPIDSMGVGVGILRIVCTAISGWIIFLILLIPGIATIRSSLK